MVSFRPSDDDARDLAPVTELFRHRHEADSAVPLSEEEIPAEGPTTSELEADVVRAISRRGLTEKEVRERVIGRDGDAEQAEAVLERMRELRYVDDERIAEEMVHRLSDGRGKSRAVVAREMAARGIDREIIDAALEGISAEHELSQAVTLALKRSAQLRGVDDVVFERRLTGYLARRGYAGAVVREAVAAARAERGSSVRFR